MSPSSTQIIQGQESWTRTTGAVSAAITVTGGMVGPVTFTLPDGRSVEPYYVNPWHADDPDVIAALEPPVLGPLRGDFFCLPFGGNNAVGQEDHLPHGEASCETWRIRQDQGEAWESRIILEREYWACPGKVVRELTFGTDSPWILSSHTLTGFYGAYPLGMHATLRGGDNRGTWTIQTAPFDFGLTDPEFAAPYASGEYSALAPGEFFHDLARVPTRWKTPGWTDCTVFPDRKGFVDIAAIFRKADPNAAPAKRLAWTVAVNNEEGYLWYSIKDAAVLPQTVFWMENGGRHGAPWSGRNSCIGIEETCGFLASGRTASVGGNAVNRRGVPTAVQLSSQDPAVIRTLQGVLPLKNTDISVIGLETTGADDTSWQFLLADGTVLPLNAPVSYIQ
jgi:hypothetical protein